MNGSQVPRRPVVPADGEAVAKQLARGLGELVGGNPGIFLDRPGFIAGGGPDNPLANAVRGLSQYNCRVWAAADKSRYSTRVNVQSAALCEPYLESIGENPGDGDAMPQFTGGQCPGVEYRADVTNGGGPGQGTINFQDFGPGPVGGWRRVPTGAVNPITGRPFERIEVTFADGPKQSQNSYALSDSEWATFALFVIRPDGQPDTCGNPPATTIRPPNTVTPVTPIPPRITIDFPGIGPINVTVTPTPDGDPVICVEEFQECEEVPVGEEPGGDGGGGGGAPTNPGLPGDPVNTGSGGEAEGEAGEGEELTGVLVEVLSSPPNANRFDNVSATVLRGIGYVAMGYPGLLGIDTSASTVLSPQFFHAQQRGLTAWRVRANIGFNLRTTPYYRETEL